MTETALGNALMQLVDLGELHGLQQVWAIACYAPRQVFLPQDAQASR